MMPRSENGIPSNSDLKPQTNNPHENFVTTPFPVTQYLEGFVRNVSQDSQPAPRTTFGTSISIANIARRWTTFW
ncbi:hypothetical protein RRSWK_05479 [Rhodopirellula sp. SWK7]|nr:hypothetical protein RRSWK_05479 [Rhodopirellula sp. SWK7]